MGGDGGRRAGYLRAGVPGGRGVVGQLGPVSVMFIVLLLLGERAAGGVVLGCLLLALGCEWGERGAGGGCRL